MCITLSQWRIYLRMERYNFRTQLRYAREADEKAAMYLRWAAGK